MQKWKVFTNLNLWYIMKLSVQMCSASSAVILYLWIKNNPVLNVLYWIVVIKIMWTWSLFVVSFILQCNGSATLAGLQEALVDGCHINHRKSALLCRIVGLGFPAYHAEERGLLLTPVFRYMIRTHPSWQAKSYLKLLLAVLGNSNM